MNQLAVFRLAVSYRNELLIVFGTLAFIFLMPIVAIITIANAGVSAVSNALVSVNIETKLVEIHDPNGRLVKTLSVSDTWPVAGVVSLEFGAPNFPYQASHTGIDIADYEGKIGRPVTPFMEGTVSEVVNYDNEYGRYVFIDHGNHIQSQYWHLSEATATVGQVVKPGNTIGLEGMTGRATGPHLHFQINVYGVPVNPRNLFSSNPPRGD